MATTVITRRTSEETAAAAAGAIAATLRGAIAARGRASIACSGGSTPPLMLAALAREALQWDALHVFQVDERVAPPDDADRNLGQLRAFLVERADIPASNVHPMPVDALLARPEDDGDGAAEAYAQLVHRHCGGVIDVVHLGLGDDGHTASLVPGDPVLDVAGRDVALCGSYKGRRRMTLTFDAIDRARLVVWLVTGASKATVLPMLLAGDRSIPAGRVRSANAVVFADDAAAAKLAE